MLAFVMLWAYFSFSQYLIIWSGNLPRGDRVVHAPAPDRLAGGRHRADRRALRRAVRACCCRGRSSAQPRAARQGRGRRSWSSRLVDLFWLIAPEFHQHGIVGQLARHRAAAVARRDLARLLRLAAARPRDPAGPRSASSTKRSAGSSSAARRHSTADCASLTMSWQPDVRHETSDVNIRGDPRRSAPAWSADRRGRPRADLAAVRLLRRAATAQTGPREYPLAVAQEQRLPPEPRLQTEPARGPRRPARARRRGARQLRLGGQERRRRADSDRRGDEADARAGTARSERSDDADDKDTADSRRSSSLCVHRVLLVPSRRADGRRPGEHRLQARAGHAVVCAAGAAARDRLRSEHRPAPAARRRRSATRTAGPCGSATTSGSGPVVLVFAYYDCPMLCTQVINGLASALGVLSLEPGTDFEIVTVSFDPRDTPATAAAKKAAYLERYSRPGAAAAWHFLTGDQPAIERLTQGGRLPLRLGRGDEAVRAPERRHRADAGRPARAIPVRHRVRPARSAARHRRGVGGQGRHGRRLAAALLLSLRPDDRPLRPRDHARDARWRGVLHRPRRSARSSSSWCARERPDSYLTSYVVRHSALSRSGLDHGGPRRRALLLPARRLAVSSRCSSPA